MELTVGIDPNLTCTGCVALDPQEGLVATKAVKVDSKGWQIERVIKMARWTTDAVLKMGGHDCLVVIEGYAMGSKFNRELCGEVCGLIKSYIFLEKLKFIVVNPLQVKKFITGKGRATKEEVAEIIKRDYGWEFGTTDESDACALALVGQALREKDYSHRPKHQQEVLNQLGGWENGVMLGTEPVTKKPARKSKRPEKIKGQGQIPKKTGRASQKVAKRSCLQGRRRAG